MDKTTTDISVIPSALLMTLSAELKILPTLSHKQSNGMQSVACSIILYGSTPSNNSLWILVGIKMRKILP